MARIRTIKPQFFRHELLQDLEQANPCKYIMLTFLGLLTQCDSKGRFENKPRTLKLDILPFLDFDIATTLKILADNNFIEFYEVDNKKYGAVVNFEKHQRINGKEAQEGERFPEKPLNTEGYDREETENNQVSNGEEMGKQQGSTQLPRNKERGKEIYTHTRAREENFLELESNFHFHEKYFTPEAQECPHEKIIELYHELLPDFIRVKEWTARRRQLLLDRWISNAEYQSLDFWRMFFEKIKKSEFLTKKADFNPSLKWLLQQENFLEILEGKYDNAENTSNSKSVYGKHRQSKAASFASESIKNLQRVFQNSE